MYRKTRENAFICNVLIKQFKDDKVFKSNIQDEYAEESGLLVLQSIKEITPKQVETYLYDNYIDNYIIGNFVHGEFSIIGGYIANTNPMNLVTCYDNNSICIKLFNLLFDELLKFADELSQAFNDINILVIDYNEKNKYNKEQEEKEQTDAFGFEEETTKDLEEETQVILELGIITKNKLLCFLEE